MSGEPLPSESPLMFKRFAPGPRMVNDLFIFKLPSSSSRRMIAGYSSNAKVIISPEDAFTMAVLRDPISFTTSDVVVTK